MRLFLPPATLPALWASVYCAPVHADYLPLPEASTVSPLEQLFRLEIEFHRRLRTFAPGTADASSVHASYALQAGYEQLIRSIGPITARDVESLRERLALISDA